MHSRARNYRTPAEYLRVPGLWERMYSRNCELHFTIATVTYGSDRARRYSWKITGFKAEIRDNVNRMREARKLTACKRLP